MTDHEPGPPPAAPAGGGGYQVPPQHRAPPDADRPPRAWGPGSETSRNRPAWAAAPPLVPPDEPTPSPWGPPTAAMSSEPGRWGPAPFNRTGGTALIDRPTAVRRPVVAPAVVPAPVRQPEPAWEWERSHRLRNALLVAAAVLLIGSLIAAYLVFRDGEDEPDTIPTAPAGLTPGEVVVQPVAPGGVGVDSTLPSIAPVTPPPPPVAPATTAVTVKPAPPVAAAPVTQAPATTARPVAVTTTTRPKAIPPLPTTRPPTVVSTTTSTTQPRR